MNKPETIFWHWLKLHLPSKTHIQRIETNVNRGVPDLNICFDGKEHWIELKVTKTNRTVTRLRKEQFAWMYKRMLAGSRTSVLCRCLDSKNVKHWIFPFKTTPGAQGFVNITELQTATYTADDFTKRFEQFLTKLPR